MESLKEAKVLSEEGEEALVMQQSDAELAEISTLEALYLARFHTHPPSDLSPEQIRDALEEA